MYLQGISISSPSLTFPSPFGEGSVVRLLGLRMGYQS